MAKPIMLIILISGILLGYFFFVKPRMVEKTEYEACYEKCVTPIIGNSSKDCKRFCGENHELRSKTLDE